jgi:hypothetical protein
MSNLERLHICPRRPIKELGVVDAGVAQVFGQGCPECRRGFVGYVLHTDAPAGVRVLLVCEQCCGSLDVTKHVERAAPGAMSYLSIRACQAPGYSSQQLQGLRPLVPKAADRVASPRETRAVEVCAAALASLSEDERKHAVPALMRAVRYEPPCARCSGPGGG